MEETMRLVLLPIKMQLDKMLRLAKEQGREVVKIELTPEEMDEFKASDDWKYHVQHGATDCPERWRFRGVPLVTSKPK